MAPKYGDESFRRWFGILLLHVSENLCFIIHNNEVKINNTGNHKDKQR